jgi:hypothetical protein
MACTATLCEMTPKAVTARSASDEAVPTFARGDCFVGRKWRSLLAVTGPRDVISSRAFCGEGIPDFRPGTLLTAAPTTHHPPLAISEHLCYNTTRGTHRASLHLPNRTPPATPTGPPCTGIESHKKILVPPGQPTPSSAYPFPVISFRTGCHFVQDRHPLPTHPLLSTVRRQTLDPGRQIVYHGIAQPAAARP